MGRFYLMLAIIGILDLVTCWCIYKSIRTRKFDWNYQGMGIL